MLVSHKATQIAAAINGYDDVLYQIYLHVSAVSDSVRIVNDGIEDAVRVDNGGGLVYAVPSAAASFVSGGGVINNSPYIVIEPVDAMPSGSRWQLQILRHNANSLIYVWAPDGGWDSTEKAGNGGFPAAGISTEGAVKEWCDGAVMPAGSSLYIASSDVPTYGSPAKNYTVFWTVIREAAGTQNGAIRAGGYVPFDDTSDTGPCCVLARVAWTTDVIGYWGYDTVAAANLNRTPTDYAHTADLDVAGHCFVRTTTGLPGFGKDYNTKYAGLPIYLMTTAGNTLGFFQSSDMLGCDSALPMWDTDAGNTKLVVDDIMFHFEP